MTIEYLGEIIENILSYSKDANSLLIRCMYNLFIDKVYVQSLY